MHVTMLIVILCMTELKKSYGRRRITDFDEGVSCHVNECGGVNHFNCLCEEERRNETDQTPSCIPPKWLCDGHQDCDNNADEIECSCPPGHKQCGSDHGGEAENALQQYNCIDIELVGDGRFDCLSQIDEFGPPICVNSKTRCNGFISCPDGADEMNCSQCPLFPPFPNRCSCNKPDQFTCKGNSFTCFPDSYRCDGRIHCSDSSDEDGCTCADNQFTCHCHRTNRRSCSYYSRGCISRSQYHNGVEDCDDGSDEREYLRRTRCDACDVTVRRLDFIQQCHNFPDCDNTTCIAVPALNCKHSTQCNDTEIICSSHCNTANTPRSCNSMFQCESGYLEIVHNFCDGKIDCPDGSDEIGNQPGFKCSASFGRCVLPQINLHDDFPQCSDDSDQCSDLKPCFFECLDGRLNISLSQLCDGVIDCFDLSDECLCETYFNKKICEELFKQNDPFQLKCGKVNPQCENINGTLIETAQCHSLQVPSSSRMPSHIRCQTKHGEVTAVTCDGRPECSRFEDECACDNPAQFCFDNCHNYYPLGDRYCDGIVDEAWKYINDSSCFEGFDEQFCPQRFACKAVNRVSIDLTKVCDKIKDCDDGSDEINCTENYPREPIFSSDTEMIENVALRSIFWVMSMIVIIGNSIVFFSNARLIYQEKMTDSKKMNHILILNLSFSDFVMGVYLFLISVKSAQYSGHYGNVDYQWRTSLECSIIGSLAVISSETSCFVLTIITAFRLYSIFNPFTARTSSILKWKLGIVLAWSISLLLAVFPIFKMTYFIHDIWFDNQFTSSKNWYKTDVISFACRLASLSNQSIEVNGDSWISTKAFLEESFPDFWPKGELGYYGETSVCLPRIYVNQGDHAWVYSLSIISLNFLSFIFIAVGYILIFCKTANPPIRSSTRSDKRSGQMQSRITRMIVTDFACWIPICIMVYLNTGGVKLDNVVYLVTAGVLLPINSALNPLLYSSVFERFAKGVFCTEKIKENIKENPVRN